MHAARMQGPRCRVVRRILRVVTQQIPVLLRDDSDAVYMPFLVFESDAAVAADRATNGQRNTTGQLTGGSAENFLSA